MNDQTPAEAAPSKVECPATTEPSIRFFIIAAMCIGFGAWCFYEAYVVGDGGKDYGNDIFNKYFNHVSGIALPILGLVPLIWGIIMLRRRLLADEEGIGYVGKEKIPWSAARSLDTGKLADKGILYLHYDAGGGERMMTLDSYKLANFRNLVGLVERKVVKKV